MRLAASLLMASVVAAFVFAIAWIRIPVSASNLATVLRTFIGYGILFAILSLTIGALLASAAARYQVVRCWLSTAAGAAVGALLGGLATYRASPSGNVVELENFGSQMQIVQNPFALTFSPWNRAAPGVIGDPPFSQADFVGSAVFCAIVGGVLGLAFWYFYSRTARHSSTG